MIREHFRLTIKQTYDILEYIRTHREAVEAEYRQVLDETEEIRQYWEKQNKKHFEKIRTTPPKPGKEQLYAKLRAAKKRLGMQ